MMLAIDFARTCHFQIPFSPNDQDLYSTFKLFHKPAMLCRDMRVYDLFIVMMCIFSILMNNLQTVI
jgi:hypothetical protein